MPNPELLHRLRAEGWMVAVHNDYRMGGEFRTFWLFTHPSGVWTKGEGASDDEALEAAWSVRPAQATEGLREALRAADAALVDLFDFLINKPGGETAWQRKAAPTRNQIAAALAPSKIAPMVVPSEFLPGDRLLELLSGFSGVVHLAPTDRLDVPETLALIKEALYRRELALASTPAPKIAPSEPLTALNEDDWQPSNDPAILALAAVAKHFLDAEHHNLDRINVEGPKREAQFAPGIIMSVRVGTLRATLDAIDRAALASTPAPIAPMVSVKALEWRELPFGGFAAEPALGGYYNVYLTDREDWIWTRNGTTALGRTHYATEAQAKAAAQADYAARILAALEPLSQAGGQEPEEHILESHIRSLMSKIYNRGHSGLDHECALCQAYIAADRLLSFETGAPLSPEVASWDAAETRSGQSIAAPSRAEVIEE